ncbi:hypothetical protein [Amycolatopsis sp. NPDC001319]|uniref:hypothetical protein n=1 Tax=unclassified Amycolatopsis TaxID=2618356 RepID=UPI0036A8C98B
MPQLTPVTREQLDGTAEYLEKMAAQLRAADPKQVRTVEVNEETTFADTPWAPATIIAAEELTVSIEWIPETDRG